MSYKNGLTVVIPAYNEEEGIGGFLDELEGVMKDMGLDYEIIVVDDGSKDSTSDIVKNKKGITLIQHPINKGYGAALKTGINNSKTEWIIIIDADRTYAPKDIPKLLEYTDNYDMVVGARTGKKVNIPALRKPAKWFLSGLANYLSGTKIPDLNSGLRLFKKQTCMEFYNILPSGFSFTTTITLSYLKNDYSVKYVPIDYYKREGKSKISPLKDGLNFILLIIKTVVYFNPLKVFLPASFFFLVTGTMIFLYQLLVSRDVGSLSVILISTAIQLAFFGLLADLIVKQRNS